MIDDKRPRRDALDSGMLDAGSRIANTRLDAPIPYSLRRLTHAARFAIMAVLADATSPEATMNWRARAGAVFGPFVPSENAPQRQVSVVCPIAAEARVLAAPKPQTTRCAVPLRAIGTSG